MKKTKKAAPKKGHHKEKPASKASVKAKGAPSITKKIKAVIHAMSAKKAEKKAVAAKKPAPKAVETKGKKPAAPVKAASTEKAGKKAAAPAPTKEIVTEAKGKAVKGGKAPAAATAVVSTPPVLTKPAKGKKGGKSAASFHEPRPDGCREPACEALGIGAGYCRLHYIKNWKKIKRKELILKEGKLNQYIEELVAKYPEKYIEAIRQDLANPKDFGKVIYDLDLDEGVDEFSGDDENVEAIVDNIKRDFDDDADEF